MEQIVSLCFPLQTSGGCMVGLCLLWLYGSVFRFDVDFSAI